MMGRLKHRPSRRPRWRRGPDQGSSQRPVLTRRRAGRVRAEALKEQGWAGLARSRSDSFGLSRQILHVSNNLLHFGGVLESGSRRDAEEGERRGEEVMLAQRSQRTQRRCAPTTSSVIPAKAGIHLLTCGQGRREEGSRKGAKIQEGAKQPCLRRNWLRPHRQPLPQRRDEMRPAGRAQDLCVLCDLCAGSSFFSLRLCVNQRSGSRIKSGMT
jgi:hypothetical protein